MSDGNRSVYFQSSFSIMSADQHHSLYLSIHYFVYLPIHRLNTDILFGRQFGMKTLLVLTGISKESDLHNAPPDLIPDFYTESVANMLLAK